MRNILFALIAIATTGCTDFLAGYATVEGWEENHRVEAVVVVPPECGWDVDTDVPPPEHGGDDTGEVVVDTDTTEDTTVDTVIDTGDSERGAPCDTVVWVQGVLSFMPCENENPIALDFYAREFLIHESGVDNVAVEFHIYTDRIMAETFDQPLNETYVSDGVSISPLDLQIVVYGYTYTNVSGVHTLLLCDARVDSADLDAIADVASTALANVPHASVEIDASCDNTSI